MALIKCPECGKEFSEFASKCPNCGLPVEDAKLRIKEKEEIRKVEVAKAAEMEMLAREARKAKWKKNRKYLYAFIALVIAGIIVLICWPKEYNEYDENEVVTEEAPAVEVEEVMTPSSISFSLKGKISTANAGIDISNGEGEYYYENINNILRRKAKIKSYDNATNTLIVEAYDFKGNYVGVFDGKYDKTSYKGVFTNSKGTRIDFNFSESGNTSQESYNTTANSTSNSKSNNPGAWLVGVWKCVTPLGTLYLEIDGDGIYGDCYDWETGSTRKEHGIYTNDGVCLRYRLDGENFTTVISISSDHRLSTEGYFYEKI